MSIIKALIIKDIIFTFPHFFISIGIMIIFPIIYFIEPRSDLVFVIYVMAPFVSGTLYMGKTCYLDDGNITRSFLNSLPIKKYIRILAKYINALLILFLTIGLLSITSIIFALPVSLEAIAISITIMLLYFSVYIFLFHKFNYNAAQKTGLIFLALTMGLGILLGRNGLALDLSLISSYIYIVAVLLGFISFLVSYVCSKKFAK